MSPNKLKYFGALSLSISMLVLGGCAQIQDYGGGLWKRSQSIGNSVVSFLRPAPKQRELFLATNLPKRDIILEDIETKLNREEAEESIELSVAIFAETPLPFLRPIPELRPLSKIEDYDPIEFDPILLEMIGQQNPSEPLELENTQVDNVMSSEIDPITVSPILVAGLPDVKPKLKPKPKLKAKPITIKLPKMDDIEMLAGEPSSGRQLAFINKAGRTDIKDLNLCAKEAGTTYVESFTGYDINPDFLQCLNTKGYKEVKT